MGMRISSASSVSTSPSASAISSYRNRQQSMNTLLSDLQSGDLSGAQKAYAQLSKSTTFDSNSVMGQLGKALAQDNLSSAQVIAKSMQAQRPVSNSNSQGTSLSAMLRGQGANVNMLA